MGHEAYSCDIISIHAPREGGDYKEVGFPPIHRAFQSTPPARGATDRARETIYLLDISIHAPREGGDVRRLQGLLLENISIHAPREGGDV